MTTRSSFTALERWVMLVASAWLVTGLQLDAYAHATTPELETFWTPWHAVLYSGIAVSGLTLVWLLRPRLPVIPTYRTLVALPNALRIPMLGMAFLLVGGGIDTLWHNIFGIEQGLEIFVSPSHEAIILGMSLVAMGPVLMLATRPGDRLSAGDGFLATISALLSVLPLHIYSLHASVLGIVFFGGDGEGDFGERQVFSISGQVFHGYLASTVLLLLPIVLIGRRWRLPVGVPTALVALPAFAMHLMFMSQEPAWWVPLTISAATAAVELAFRLVRPLLALPREAAWTALGLLAPPLVFGALFAVAETQIGVGWNVHIVSGLLTYTAIFGAGTVLVARNVRPARPAASPASAPGPDSPPADSQPADSQPADSPAAASQAADSQAAADASPAGASPAGTSPAGTSPAGTSPAGTSPAGTSPAGASPAGASANGTPATEASPADSPAPAGASPAGSSPDLRGPATEVRAP